MSLDFQNKTGDPMESHAFSPRFPWWGGDLQTIRNVLIRPKLEFDDVVHQDVIFPMEDGSGDRLQGVWTTSKKNTDLPLVILIHGLTGCSESAYILQSAAYLLKSGYSVLRLNLRAAGPTLGHCNEQYHAGRSGDFKAALAQIIDKDMSSKFAAVGYSLGGNMLLKYLGETGSETPLSAAMSVSAPIDLAATSTRFHRARNFLYQRYLLNRMKSEALKARGGLPSIFQTAVAEARTVYEFDNRYIAPRFGFGSAPAYYAQCSALAFMGNIKIPTLILNSDDDPWIASEPYRNFPWDDNRFMNPILTKTGGHVGFHGQAGKVPWHAALLVGHLDKIFIENKN
jgi:predicted alpha/beta-fold hydrolase